MRLIDTDSLIVTDDYCKNATCRECTNNITNCEELKDLIDNAPTVDAVKVVRCRDCKYLPKFKINNNLYCLNENGLHGCIQLDDYCSYGERGEHDELQI